MDRTGTHTDEEDWQPYRLRELTARKIERTGPRHMERTGTKTSGEDWHPYRWRGLATIQMERTDCQKD